MSAVPRTAGATANGFPHRAMAGFSMQSGGGFWLAYANGSVAPYGDARAHGDVSQSPLRGPISAGASARDGNGYWLTAWDGGVFTFGSARYYGSMGGKRLKQPVFGITPTATGHGYWLAAYDGGVFTFGDARFYGSTGSLRLNQPVTGITTSPSGRGYRMVAKDGGIFDFGDAPYYGSLPGRRIFVTDVVGMAPTPSNKGYWVVRAGGQVYGFGDAQALGTYTALPCDPVVGIFSNPTAQGFRLITQSGATVPFGQAPGGSQITGRQQACVAQVACRATLQSAADYQALFNTRGPIWDGADGAGAIDLGDGRRLWLFGDTYSGPTDATEVLPGYGFLRNSIAIEQGGCLEFRLGGLEPMPLRIDALPPPSFEQWYWPMDGVVDRSAGVVRVSAMRVTPAFGKPGYRWRVVRNEILTLDLQSLALRSAAPMPAGKGLLWGSSMVMVGTSVYVYARSNDGLQYVARTTLAHLLDGEWEYFDGTAWSPNSSAAQPMRFLTASGSDDITPNPGITVEPDGSGFLASAKRCDIFCSDLSAWYSAAPNGPWRAVNANGGRVATTTPGPFQVSYGGHLVPIGSTWLAVWSVNRTNGSMAKSAYGPHVVSPVDLPDASTLAAAAAPAPSSAAGLRPTTATPAPPPRTATASGAAPLDLPTSSGWTTP